MHAGFIAFVIALFAVFGFILALIRVYALPDGSARPIVGSVFFLGGALSIMGLLTTIWKKEKGIFHRGDKSAQEEAIAPAPIHESVSDKILKWVITVLVVFTAWTVFP